MAQESLLARLTRRLTTQSENVATEALLYLLECHEEAADAFEALARRMQPDLPEVVSFRSQDWSGVDGAIPDLVGVDGQGGTPLVIEVKFWAPLTAHQPCTYHERLPEGSGLLLFVCPRQRVGSLQAEIQGRCEHRHSAGDDGTMVVGKGRRMAVVSWHVVLDEIETRMRDTDDTVGLSDLQQVRGLVESDDGVTFLPLATDELSGRIGHRLGQYMGLIEAVITALKVGGMADTERLAYACRVGQAYGRYLHLKGHQAQLIVHFGYWATDRDTPLWLVLAVTDAQRAEVVAATAPARNQRPPLLLERDGDLVAPLPLTVGVPEHVLVEEITERIHGLWTLLPDCVS